MSGLPASGKTTLGRQIAARLDIPFIDKDDFLEALYESEGIGNSEFRNCQSRRADEHFCHAVQTQQKAVIASWWRHPHSKSISGTSVNWLLPFADDCLEIYCQSSPHIALQRFVSRDRHPGHGDNNRDRDALLQQFETQAALGPLSIGLVYRVTSSDKKIEEQLDNITSLIE